MNAPIGFLLTKIPLVSDRSNIKRSVHAFLVLLFALLMVSACGPKPEDQSGLRKPGQGWIQLDIQSMVDSDRPRPLRGGVPLPEGKVTTVDEFQLYDSGPSPVAAQFDVTARWSDGSIRWVLVSFTGPSRGPYYVSLDGAAGAASSTNLQMQSNDRGEITIHTGQATFQFLPHALMIDAAHLPGEGGEALWANGGEGAYLIDNQGRTARVAGSEADIETEILVEGPQRITLRRSGWYVTDDGERVARATVRFGFHNQSAVVHLSHTLVFTEDTNQLWVRDYGVEIPFEATAEPVARFDLSRSGHTETVAEFSLAPGRVISMEQQKFPQFLRTESRFSILSTKNSEDPQLLMEGEVAGNWCDLAAGDQGLTLVLPDLAEQFPAALEVSPAGLRARFWAGGPDRELDFRVEALLDWYVGEWADMEVAGRTPPRETLAAIKSNAQGSARTHELWLVARNHQASTEAIAQTAENFSHPAWVTVDPEWVTATHAIGWPMHPYDPENFPEEEEIIQTFWERTFLPQEIFPMTGYIAWGAQPPHSFREVDGRWQAGFVRLAQLTEYGLRERAWTLFARSGDRRYADFGSRFNRFAHDWGMHHWTADGKYHGGFSGGTLNTPYYWGTRSFMLNSGGSGHSLQNFLFEYYLTGNERAREAVEAFAEAVLREPEEQMPHPAMSLRVLTHAYLLDRDPRLLERMKTVVHKHLIDLSSPNGIRTDIARGRPLYKTHRMAISLYEYYQATGDPDAREAFLKLVDYEFRFNRIARPVSGQNYSAHLFSLAHQMTGDPIYLRLVNGMMKGTLSMAELMLDEETNPDSGEVSLRGGTRSHNPVHMNIHPMLGMPSAMSLLAADPGPKDLPPVDAVKAGPLHAQLLFRIAPDMSEPARFRIFARTPRGETPRPVVLDPNGQPVDGIELEIEQQMLTDNVNLTPSPAGEYQFHIRLTLPADASPGLYRMEFSDQTEFVVFDTNCGPLELFVPEGAWSGYRREMTGVLPQYFLVPEGLETLELFVNTPTYRLLRPDGSEALTPENHQTGRLKIPVNDSYGFWAFESTFPVHWRLLNTSPVISLVPGSLLNKEELAALRQQADAMGGRRAATSDQFIPGPHGRAARHFPAGRNQKLEMDMETVETPMQGTIEFWFRPNWSGTELLFDPYHMESLTLLESGPVDIIYSYGVGGSSQAAFFHPRIVLRDQAGERFASRDRLPFSAYSFRKGEWAHVAANWSVQEIAEDQTQIRTEIFVNGQPLGETWEIKHPETISLPEFGEGIRTGVDLNGALSDLRISSAIRYEEPFTPPMAPLEPDEITLYLNPLSEDSAPIFPR